MKRAMREILTHRRMTRQLVDGEFHLVIKKQIINR